MVIVDVWFLSWWIFLNSIPIDLDMKEKWIFFFLAFISSKLKELVPLLKFKDLEKNKIHNSII